MHTCNVIAGKICLRVSEKSASNVVKWLARLSLILFAWFRPRQCQISTKKF